MRGVHTKADGTDEALCMRNILAWRCVALLAVLLPSANSAKAAHFSVVASVPGGPQIGAMKGTTLFGTVSNNGNGAGTLFSLTTKGSYKLLHTFSAGSDGSGPNARLAIDPTGDLFGTAGAGGANKNGTIWEYSAKGAFSNLHSFGGSGDGTYPFQGPTLGPGSLLFGTTSEGAIGNSGLIYNIGTAHAYTEMYKFLSKGDGHCPFSGVAVTSAGAIYGTAIGLGFGGNPTGSVFEYTSTGGLKTLYVFTDGNDGEWPNQAPTVDNAGNVYGTTYIQKGSNFPGAIWMISAAGTFKLLREMDAAKDGSGPNSPLLLDLDGNLYGTTLLGGAHGFGTLFRITPAGKFTVLHSFTGGSDGGQPSGNLVRDAAGTLFGGTDFGPVFEEVP
jgi:uncharacterized repeat protein (TIGR03803 family)